MDSERVASPDLFISHGDNYMVKFTCNEHLLKALELNNVPLEQYRPAYSGESAGLDLYNANWNRFHPSSGDKVLIPTGLRVIIPEGYVGIIAQRGSISKTSLVHQAGVIDRGYTGEIFVSAKSLYTFEAEGYTQECDRIEPYSKLPFQLLVLQCNNYFINIPSTEYEYLVKESQRKTGQLGSSDLVKS
jgi:dUTPase